MATRWASLRRTWSGSNPVTIRAAVAIGAVPRRLDPHRPRRGLQRTSSHGRSRREYHDGGLTTDHPGGWRPNVPTRGAQSWVKIRQPWTTARAADFELPEANAAFFVVNLAGIGEVAIWPQADVERRGDLARGPIRDGHGPLPLYQPHGRRGLRLRALRGPLPPESSYPVGVSHYAHNKHLTVLVMARAPVAVGRPRGRRRPRHRASELGPDVVKPFLDDPDFTVQFQARHQHPAPHFIPNLYAQTMDDGSPNPFLDLRVRQCRELTRSTARPSSTPSCSARASRDSSRSAASRATRSAEQKREVLFDYDPDKAIGAAWRRPATLDGFDIPLYWTPEYGGSYIADIGAGRGAGSGHGRHPDGSPVDPRRRVLHRRLHPRRPQSPCLASSGSSPTASPTSDRCAEMLHRRPGGFYTLSDPLDPSLHELYLAAEGRNRISIGACEMIAELLLEHARQAYFISPSSKPPERCPDPQRRELVSKNGAWGRLWGGTAFAASEAHLTRGTSPPLHCSGGGEGGPEG